MAHKFIYENTYEEQLPVKVEFTVPSDADLSDMCEEFTNYLRAVGFHIPQGNYLDFVNDEETPHNSWTDYFNEPQVTEDFNPRDDKISINDATPQEWDNAYKNVTVTYNGVKFQEHD